MEYRRVGRTSLEVPELCLGTRQSGWLLTNPVVTAPIVGANGVAPLRESPGAAGHRLQPGELTRHNELTKYPRNGRPIWD